MAYALLPLIKEKGICKLIEDMRTNFRCREYIQRVESYLEYRIGNDDTFHLLHYNSHSFYQYYHYGGVFVDVVVKGLDRKDIIIIFKLLEEYKDIVIKYKYKKRKDLDNKLKEILYKHNNTFDKYNFDSDYEDD